MCYFFNFLRNKLGETHNKNKNKSEQVEFLSNDDETVKSNDKPSTSRNG